MVPRALTAFVILFAGCFEPPVQSGVIACDDSELCPDGLECVSELCVTPGTSPPDAAIDDDGGPGGDAGPGSDAMVPLGAFSTPVRIAELDVAGELEDDPSVTGDLLELYYNRNNTDIMRSERASPGAAWGTPAAVTVLGTGGAPYVLPNGLVMYFASDRNGTSDVFRSSRGTRNDPWGAPASVGPPISLVGSGETGPCITSDDLVMVFASNRDGEYHLYRAARPSAAAAWGTPVLLGGTVGADGKELDCWIAPDESMLYFGSDRTGGTGPVNILQADGDGNGVYSSVSELLGTNAAMTISADPFLSLDQRTIIFAAQVEGVGDGDLYISTR